MHAVRVEPKAAQVGRGQIPSVSQLLGDNVRESFILLKIAHPGKADEEQ
jgi:hypothetical protein